MSGIQQSPSQRSFRVSNHGFQPLDGEKMGDRTTEIPLQTVVSHTPSQSAPTSNNEKSEKTGMFHRGRRRQTPINPKTGAPLPPRAHEEENMALTRMGRFYTKVLNYSIVTRYMIYVAPVALLLAIPIILSQVAKNPGTINGAKAKPFWIWIEISEYPWPRAKSMC